MPTLITLTRDTTFEELKELSKTLNAEPDPWASKRLLAKDTPQPTEGVSTIIPLDVFNEPTASLGDVVRLARKVLADHDISAFDVQLKALGDVPFHAKAIRERLMKRKTFSRDPSTIVYIEAKRKAGTILVRIGLIQKEKRDASGVTLVLEQPTTWHEAADFIRLGIAFGVPIRIVTYGDRQSEYAVKEAKQVIKGWPKAKLTVSKSLGDMTNSIGFSLWGTKTEKELRKVKAPVTFLFGNEVKGLRLSTKKRCDVVVRLGPKSSEPLRSSQAAAYALGLFGR